MPGMGGNAPMPMPQTAGMQAMPAMGEMHVAENPIGIPATRYGSGTSWLPDSTPMYAVMLRAGPWDMMYHGAAFLAYDKMNGSRGDSELVLPNWEMATAARRLNPRSDLRLSIP